MRIVRFSVDVSEIRQLRHRKPLQPADSAPQPTLPPAEDPGAPGAGPTVRANPADTETRRS